MIKRHSYLALTLLIAIIIQATYIVLVSSNANCTQLYFLAYDQKSRKGSVVRATLCIYRSDHLDIEIVGAKYKPSVIDSFLIALKTASRICSRNVSKLKVVIKFYGNFYIEGASGSLLLTAGVLKLLNISSFSTPLSATGVVSIDGFVDPVGAITYKLEAAKSSNISSVYLPLLNYVLAENVSGIKKVYVDTLLELCPSTKIPKVNASILYKVNSTFIELIYDRLRKDVTKFLSMSREYVEKLPEPLKDKLRAYLSKREEEVNELLKEGHVYSAASISFGTYLSIANASLAYTNLTYLSKLVDHAVNTANRVYERIEKARSISMNSIPFLLVVLNRIKETIYFANLFRNASLMPSIAKMQLPKLAVLASRAYGRSLTVLTWFKLLEIANSSGGPYLDTKLVLDSSWRVLDLISEMIELGKSYAPLSLDAIASTRSYLASAYNASFDRKVLRDLKLLLSINLANLTPVQRVVPYLYIVYGNDLAKIENASISTQIFFYSLANLLASATEEVMSSVTKRHVIETSWKPTHEFISGALYASSAIAASSSLLAFLLLKVVEKSSRRHRSAL